MIWGSPPKCKIFLKKLKTGKNLWIHMDTDDKYALPLLMKEKQSEILKIAAGNSTFKRWKVQNDQKFGYIPLANQKIPIYDRNRFLDLNPIQLHNKVKKSNIPNFWENRFVLRQNSKLKIGKNMLQSIGINS